MRKFTYKEVRISMDNPNETRRYKAVSDTDKARWVVLRKNLIPETKWRAGNRYSERVGWVTIEIEYHRPFKTLLQRMVDKIKDAI